MILKNQYIIKIVYQILIVKLMGLNRPTLHLPNSSTLVGFFGGLRLFLGYVLTGFTPSSLSGNRGISDHLCYLYTLDLSLGHTKDETSRGELSDANKTAGLRASGCALMTGALLFSTPAP